MTVAVGSTTTLDITLSPAGVSTEVTVTDRPPALDASQTVSTTSVDPERIEELPVNSRNYLEFTLLAPGVAPSNTKAAGGGSNGSASGAPLSDSSVTFGGLRPRSNAISIDGLDNTDETTGAARGALSPEIVREFQVVNNGLSAEFGSAAGGAINVVTRTGASEWHGDVFTFLQNERLNARAPISDRTPSARPRFVTPYSAQANVGVERLLSPDVTVRADYLFTRGIHLPRTRNVNLLPPVLLTTANASALGFSSPTPQQLGRPVFGPGRIDPRFDAVYQLENSASSTYHGLTLALNRRLSDEFELLASYTLSKTVDDASDSDE